PARFLFFFRGGLGGRLLFACTTLRLDGLSCRWRRRCENARLELGRFRRFRLHLTFQLENYFSVGTEEGKADFGARLLIANQEIDDHAVRRIRPFCPRPTPAANSATREHPPCRCRREEMNALRSNITRAQAEKL